MLISLCSVLLGLSAVAETSAPAPGKAPVDVFHPERSGATVKSAFGGRVILHMSSMPENLCYPVENSAYTRRILYSVHETLLQQNWETWKFDPVLCRTWEAEDALVLKPGTGGTLGSKGRSLAYPNGEGESQARHVVYGAVTRSGDLYRVEGRSRGNPIGVGQVLEVPFDQVDRVEQGTVFTFRLREDARWHPSPGFPAHRLDARDVLFSWELYANPHVDCDEKRFQFQKVLAGEIVDSSTVRFFYAHQYAFAIDTIGDMTIVPSHIYDLGDPDNPDHDVAASAEQKGEHINHNSHNLKWIGLGPYRITAFDPQFIEAERWDDYFEPAKGGYLDVIRWRVISDDNAAFQALLAGEVDYFDRVKSEDYFGEATEKPTFTDTYYKGYYYLGTYGYTGWNMLKPQLSELPVRQALAHAFDFDQYKRTNYKGLANQVTGPFPFSSDAYNRAVKPFAYDLDLAEEMLAEAGWYDRDGDGVADKDGVALEIEFLMPAGNEASKTFALKYQENLERIGVRLKIRQAEWAAFLDDILNRRFDSCNLAWVPSLESDPEQLWHSKWGARDVRGSNHSALRDAEVDRLIEAGQRELDRERRMGIWQQLHARIYELQPYLFLYNVPIKFAINRNIRGVQQFAIDPGYDLRRWHYPAGTPGTRSSRDR